MSDLLPQINLDIPMPPCKPSREAIKTCPNLSNHTKEPMAPHDYLGWHRWAEEMSKTHKQIRCEGCGLWAIWIPKNAKSPTT
jgi:hypothetical protein